MDLRTRYLGFELKSPLVASASPLSEDLDSLEKLAEVGAAAIVLHSLFEEQIQHEQDELLHHLEYGTESYAEALSYFPEPASFPRGPERYLEHIAAAKDRVDIPIIASLNGHTLGGWIDYAQKIEAAGADALELNIYHIPTNIQQSGAEIEKLYLDIVAAVRQAIQIPLAVKIGPYFSNMAYMGQALTDKGADALVLFNRFYQPDIHLDTLEVRPHLKLSSSLESRLPMTWIALLYGRIKADFAATSGVHRVEDIVKLLMAGANVTMLCSALLKTGVHYLEVLEEELYRWLEINEYDSVQQMQGSMSQLNCANPEAFERAQYMRTLQSYVPHHLRPL